MRLTAAVLLGFLLAPVLSSQPAAAGDRPNLLQDYLRLLAEWRRTDALLSTAADPKELLSRINEAEEKWTAAAAAKDRYLKAIRPLHHPRSELLAGAVIRSADTSRVESAHENVLTDLSADLANLERKLKEGGFSERRRAALQQQRDSLAALRDLYRSRLRAFEQLRQINQALEKTWPAGTGRWPARSSLRTTDSPPRSRNAWRPTNRCGCAPFSKRPRPRPSLRRLPRRRPWASPENGSSPPRGPRSSATRLDRSMAT
jgi:hypothetical protein